MHGKPQRNTMCVSRRVQTQKPIVHIVYSARTKCVTCNGVSAQNINFDVICACDLKVKFKSPLRDYLYVYTCTSLKINYSIIEEDVFARRQHGKIYRVSQRRVHFSALNNVTVRSTPEFCLGNRERVANFARIAASRNVQLCLFQNCVYTSYIYMSKRVLAHLHFYNNSVENFFN